MRTQLHISQDEEAATFILSHGDAEERGSESHFVFFKFVDTLPPF